MIRVEFFGIPRMRVGMHEIVVLEGRESATLGEVLDAVATRHPEFAEACLDGKHLEQGFLANIDGDQFERKLDAVISDQQTVLILSADAGG